MVEAPMVETVTVETPMVEMHTVTMAMHIQKAPVQQMVVALMEMELSADKADKADSAVTAELVAAAATLKHTA
jgi:hypothetical protein